MKKLESSLTNMIIVLVAVAVVSGGLLAWVNNVTEAPIKEQDELALANGIKSVMGVDDLTVTVNDEITKNIGGKDYTFIVHKTSDAHGNFLGAAVESTTMGFGGDLKVLVGFDGEGNILGYTILQHAETPGLGAKADKWFQKDGKGSIIGRHLDASTPLVVSKDGGDVDAITASTITSRAFLKAVNQAYAAYADQDVDGMSGATKQAKAACDGACKSECSGSCPIDGCAEPICGKKRD
jgi:electron transport complex protein RnfG